jgi:hypothetical protein
MSYKRVPLATVAAPQDQDRLAALEAAGRLGTALTPAEAEARRPEPPAGPKIKPENSAHMAQIVLESAQPIPGEDPVRLLGAHPDSDSHKPSK